VNATHHTAILVRPDGLARIRDRVAVETTVTISCNGLPVSTQVASPDHLRELGAGHVVTGGICRRVVDVCVNANTIDVRGEEGAFRDLTSPVESRLKITPDLVFGVHRSLESGLWAETGGVHTAVLFSGGDLRIRASDIGRHNAVDKCIGHMVLTGLDPALCVLGCTGRQPSPMVVKAARAGIPVVISRASATDRGIALAGEAGITLICFARKGRFTVYTHPERIEGLPTRKEDIESLEMVSTPCQE